MKVIGDRSEDRIEKLLKETDSNRVLDEIMQGVPNDATTRGDSPPGERHIFEMNDRWEVYTGTRMIAWSQKHLAGGREHSASEWLRLELKDERGRPYEIPTLRDYFDTWHTLYLLDGNAAAAVMRTMFDHDLNNPLMTNSTVMNSLPNSIVMHSAPPNYTAKAFPQEPWCIRDLDPLQQIMLFGNGDAATVLEYISQRPLTVLNYGARLGETKDIWIYRSDTKLIIDVTHGKKGSPVKGRLRGVQVYD